MKKAWKVIFTVVLIAILLGALCVGVGLLTGARLDNIYDILEERYNLEVYYRYVGEVINAVSSVFTEI